MKTYDERVAETAGMMEMSTEAVEMVLAHFSGKSAVAVSSRPLRKNCPHEGTYQGHDEGCYPIVWVPMFWEDES